MRKQKHKDRLDKALATIRKRNYWSAFQSSPRKEHHPEGANQAGKNEFQQFLHRRFPMTAPANSIWVGSEVSPMTKKPLGIQYPRPPLDTIFSAAETAFQSWKRVAPDERVHVCLHLLDRLSEKLFVNAYATMHTAGQPFMTAFAGSGANALDRGLEAVAQAHLAMSQIPKTSQFQRSFGRSSPVYLNKQFRLMPLGVAVVVCCGTFPTWNAYPAMFANLATGNPVLIKPHPNGILPMAIVVQTCRSALAEVGMDPNLVQLVPDEQPKPVTVALLQHADTKIIDFTGSPVFGNWIERSFTNKLVFTETAGCNSVVVESTDNIDGMLNAIAQSLCLFSSQMCTSAQNIFIPKTGIVCRGQPIAAQELIDRLVRTVDGLLQDPKWAAGLCGAIMSQKTLDDIQSLHQIGLEQGVILRPSSSYVHPDFPEAQTATPLIVQLEAKQSEVYRREFFGPMAFVILTNTAEESVQQATKDAHECGAISCYLYSSNEDFLERSLDQYAEAGASVGCNLMRHLPINYSAAYSDFHVTGLNPAGNACLTDLAFVTSRFRIVQSKIEREAT